MAEPTITGITVTATDPETGEEARQKLEPGQYAVVCMEPRYLASKQVYRNGTVVLTLKLRRQGGADDG